MGRPSKLTDAQWNEVKKRVLAGEKPASLAREFKVSKAAISSHVSKRIETVKSVADQIVSAERALGGLSVSEQLMAVNFAATLRSISTSVLGAADYGAKTALRLQALANAEVQKIDDANPLTPGSIQAMKGVSLLTRLANDSAATALNLLSANKESARPPPETPRTVTWEEFYGDTQPERRPAGSVLEGPGAQ